ncbi:MAG: single-stranded-DNA-specific exonuclease RecJ [Alphaproteobacteria bacterium]|nr:single-stranded-DNA-specific exonuclease RecJ [Alphaproteobacteria bacterium]
MSDKKSNTNTPFLGIDDSVLHNIWIARPYNQRTADAIAQRFSLPDAVAKLVASRGVELDDAENFLHPTLKTTLPNPSNLKDMDKAVEYITNLIKDGKKIGIFGDYDVDGATSSALLHNFIKEIGGDAEIHIPDREGEGYGPNMEAFELLVNNGAAAVVTVDCGSSAFEPLKQAKESGIDIVVIDHHETTPALPDAIAIVNPKRLDDESGTKYLAAVGVVFLLVVGLNRELRTSGWYKQQNIKEPDLKQWLDMIALGTVCDMVPLVGANRAFIKTGLQVMSHRKNKGLVALADISNINEKPTSYHMGYILGPRINAGGRVGKASLGAALLSCNDEITAEQIARQLEEYNMERREIEAATLIEAIEQVETTVIEDYPFIFAFSEKWHPGVVGIVAGRLKDRYGLPTCVMTAVGGEVKGSGRSINSVDLGAAIIAAVESGILLKGGGHAMAAGFSLQQKKLEELRNFLGERIKKQIGSQGIVPTLKIDGAIDIMGVTIELLETMESLAPYGSGNPKPRFVIPNVEIARPEIVGAGHIKCFLKGQPRGWIKSIAFRQADTELGQAMLRNSGEKYHVAGTLKVDRWKGRESIQMTIDDMALAV